MAQASPSDIVSDGFLTLLGGMHSGIHPGVIAEDAYARGINVSVRGGLVKSRPGFVKACSALPEGTFQGAKAWQLHDVTRIVVVVSGRVHLVDVSDYSVVDLGALLDASAQCHMVQADRFFVIQDGTSSPVVLEDTGGVAAVKTLNPLDTSSSDVNDWIVPMWPGTVMAYANVRLHMVPVYVPFSDPVVSGRPYFLSGNALSALDPSSCLYFEEPEYFAGGGATGLPLEMGYVTGMAPLRGAATGTGYGNLVVFAERGVAAFDVSLSRTLWQDEQFGQVLFFSAGCLSPWSIVPVNGTLAYRSVDGLRILSYAVTSASSTGDTLSNISQSMEVDVFMGQEDAPYLPYVSGMFAFNRAFFTVGGTGTREFKGMVVLDTARVATMDSVRGEQAYDGLWQIEGRTIRGVVQAYRNNVEVPHVILDGNEIWRLDEAAVLDDTSTITSRLVTRALLRSSSDLKRLKSAELWLSDLRHDTTVTVYYRPLGYPYWASLGSKTFKVAGSAPQRRRKVSWNCLDSSALERDPVLHEHLRLSHAFQFAIQWTGHAVIEQFVVTARYQSEPPGAGCDETEAVEIVPGGSGGIELEEFL